MICTVSEDDRPLRTAVVLSARALTLIDGGFAEGHQRLIWAAVWIFLEWFWIMNDMTLMSDWVTFNNIPGVCVLMCTEVNKNRVASECIFPASHHPTVNVRKMVWHFAPANDRPRIASALRHLRQGEIGIMRMPLMQTPLPPKTKQGVSSVSTCRAFARSLAVVNCLGFVWLRFAWCTVRKYRWICAATY